MRIFVPILAIFFLVSCSTQERESIPQPNPVKSSSSKEIPSSSSIKAAGFAEISSSEESLPAKFSLSVKNATGSGSYAAGESVPLKAKKEPGECADRWEILPKKYETSLKMISEDSAAFNMPAEDVEISVRVRSCFANVQGTLIGKLRWMTKNANVPTASGSSCYGKKVSNCKKYGRLYDFNAAKEVCRDGWRLPTDAEWTEMIESLGEESGKLLKSQSGWASDGETSGNGTDSVQFHALPSGIVYEKNFMYLGHHAYFWTATERDETTAYYRSLSYDSPESYRYHNFKTAGYAVRCVQDAN